MIWIQQYDPLGSPLLSTLVAALPIVLLLGLLATGRVSAAQSALAGLASAVLAAIFVFQPAQVADHGLGAWAQTVLTSAANGAAFGLFPIGYIVLAAIFLYALTVETGQFEVVKHSVMALSDDRRIQALLIAFCFGAFIEGAAGFGTPVAISAALMMGAGFKPLQAAVLALIANTSPVAFGALGTPIITLAKVTGIDELTLSAMAGRQLPFFSLIVPVWLVWTMAGWRATLAIWPALLVCGGSFALVQFLVSNFHGPWLVDVAGGLVALVALALFLRFWQPAIPWHFPDEPPPPPQVEYTTGQIVNAWVPWVLLSTFVFIWGLPQFKDALKPTVIEIPVPGLHQQIARQEPVVPAAESGKPENAIYNFNWLTATGTGIMVAALVSSLWLGIAPLRTLRIFLETLHKVRVPLFTIACMLAIAFTTRYSGMDATLGLAFTHTGVLYPLFAAMLGWLGVALTGSDTSSNALFGSLQTITAQQLVERGYLPLDVGQAQVLLASANSTGGVMGKMIDAQSIVVAAVATEQHNQEGTILRHVFWHSVALAVLMGILVMVQAYWWTASIPGR